MKISKKPKVIKANDEVLVDVVEPVAVVEVTTEAGQAGVQEDTTTVDESIVKPLPEPAVNSYECAISYINNAIDSLAEIAKTDEIAREAIANLSVVLFDLK